MNKRGTTFQNIFGLHKFFTILAKSCFECVCVCVCHIFSYDFIHLCTIFSLLLFRLVFCICNYFCRHHTSFYRLHGSRNACILFRRQIQTFRTFGKIEWEQKPFFCAVMATFFPIVSFRLFVCVCGWIFWVWFNNYFSFRTRDEIFSTVIESAFFSSDFL